MRGHSDKTAFPPGTAISGAFAQGIMSKYHADMDVVEDVEEMKDVTMEGLDESNKEGNADKSMADGPNLGEKGGNIQATFLKDPSVVSNVAFNFDSDEEADVENNATPANTGCFDRALNVEKLRELIRRGEETLRHIEGKDVVLIVGKTGTGKSTLMQGIAGKTFTQTFYSYGRGNGTAKKEVFDAVDPIPGFEIGHARCSKTKGINFYVVGSNDDARGAAYYLDTPGFGDTDGEEVDIATSALLAQISKKSRSIRFIVMIDYMSLFQDRGGSMRSTLKFIRSFVRDFEKNKMSFMFLFTHADAVSGVPKSLEGARKCLLDEIIATMESTKSDDDAMKVLRYIRKSLEKGFPFVDVMHPLRTDFSKITESVACHLERVTFADGNFVPCTLTNSSRTAMIGAIRGLQSNLHLLLGRDSIDIRKVKYIQEAFKFFGEYFDFDEMRSAIVDCNEVIERHVKRLHEIVETEVNNGTISSNKLFTEHNVRRLEEALKQLEVIDSNNFDFPAECRRIRQQVTRFQKSLFLKKTDTFYGFPTKLQTLHAWCALDAEFQKLFNEVTLLSNELVKNAVHTVLNFDPLQASSASQGIHDITEVASSLNVLKSIHENAEALSTYLDGIKEASHQYNMFTLRLKGYFDSIDLEHHSFAEVENFDVRNLQTIQAIYNRIESLENLSKLVNECDVRGDISHLLKDLKNTFGSQIANKFAEACKDTKTKVENRCLEDIPDTLTILRDLMTSFSNFEGNHWKEMSLNFNTVVDEITFLARADASALEEMSLLLLTHGITDGKKDGELVSRLLDLRWVDEFLSAEESIVQGCVSKTKDNYFYTCASVSQTIKEILFKLSSVGSPADSMRKYVEAAKELKGKMSQISEFAHFGSITDDKRLNGLLKNLIDCFDGYVKQREIVWRKTLDEWTGLVNNKNVAWDELTAATGALDKAIEEIDQITNFPLNHDIKLFSQSVKEDILLATSNFGREVHQSLTSEINYDELADILARVATCGKFSNIAPYLPKMDSLKQIASDRIARDANRIEDVMKQTSNFDLIDKHFEALDKASVLEEFIPEALETRLRPLKRIRREKSEESRNKKSIRMIQKCLQKIENDFLCDLYHEINEENCEKIASSLQILEQATQSVETVHIKVSKEKLNVIFYELEDRVGDAIREMKFKSVVELNYRSSFISSHMGRYLNQKSKEKMEANSKDLLSLKFSIPKKINEFINSSFAEPETVEKLFGELEKASKSKAHGDDLSRLYEKNKETLCKEVNDLIEILRKSGAELQCYDDYIMIMKNLERCLENGLKHHLSQNIVNKAKSVVETFVRARDEQNLELEGNSCFETMIKKYTEQLNKTAPNSGFWRKTARKIPFANKFVSDEEPSQTYERLKREFEAKTIQRYIRGCQALERREFITLNESLLFLGLVDSKARNHIGVATEKASDLKKKTKEAFLLLSESCQDVLKGNNCRKFEPLFVDFRGFVLNISCLMEDSTAEEAFHLVNQNVAELLQREILSLKPTINSFDFGAIKEKIEYLRQFGGFIADHYSLFYEELRSCTKVKGDKWLTDVDSCIAQNFQNGRDLTRIKYFAVLGILPSASKREVKKAYQEKILIYHPDKCKDARLKDICADKFILVREAYEKLKNHCLTDSSKPFDKEIRSISARLRMATAKALNEQHYDRVEKLLFNLEGIGAIQSMVSPNLETRKIRNHIHSMVKNHVLKVRTEVETSWSERKFQDLNQNIKDLKMMENKFKSYPSIFPTSWNTGIMKSVEVEIDTLGREAQALLGNEAMATKNRAAFRRCFLKMGAVFVELPVFKDHTKKVMSDVLEFCLNKVWGYSYVFDLGLALQRGVGTDGKCDAEDARIAQNLVGEFQHFKEVLTMVWNEETIQKPPQETIKDILGQRFESDLAHPIRMNLDLDKLLEQCLEFESIYTAFLTEYLHPEADITALVNKTIQACEVLKPISSDDGFGAETKRALPTILAGVFAVFTIIKSGESYNRLAEDTNRCEFDAKKVLMKPHNIQVYTILCMLGCGASESASLKSQLLQIRTGEGKSIILGATAVVLGLLNFRVRCVCYSQYLSARDYELFHETFHRFGLERTIKYSKITTLSEDRTSAKGDIRNLTLSLLQNALVGPEGSSLPPDILQNQQSEEIILVDEVDVFFGSDFYGQTYNKVAQLKEPEVAAIMKHIWESHKRGKRLLLADIKALPEYKTLLLKIPGHDYLLENELLLMLDQVKRVDDEPAYYLNRHEDKIGYKVHDTISYNMTYGYRTAFAYLKESDNGNLKDAHATLSRTLTMPISCGQFSYANFKPKRILGVSGTLDCMNDYEKAILKDYGVDQYLYVPSVYGKSNFSFDKNGKGITIEKGVSNFFQRITNGASKIATKENRAVIIFFGSPKRLKEYTNSSFYRKLGRKKEILVEDKTTKEKEFVISKAATTGQITICTSVFGRGTDFFCKDSNLEKNGGVHIIQAFLSSDVSEEVQIQGRTARQGKCGSYELILLQEDLENDFAIDISSIDQWPHSEYYTNLCKARQQNSAEKQVITDTNLLAAMEKDKATHNFFDALLKPNVNSAKTLFKDLYLSMKKAKVEQINLDVAFAIDVTGSMAVYKNAISSTIESLLVGSKSLLTNFEKEFQRTEFTLRVAILGYRDIEDGNAQFVEIQSNSGSHFNENMQEILHSVERMTLSSSGGADIAEDHLGAIHRCLSWNSPGDWEGHFKAILLLTDAPAHGYVPTTAINTGIDNYSLHHPSNLTVNSITEELASKDVDLFVCSFDTTATARFVEAMQARCSEEPSSEGRAVSSVPMVLEKNGPNSTNWQTGDSRKHNIFVLDESGSMEHEWAGLISVYNQYIENRQQRQCDSDLVSIIQFGNEARTTCQLESIGNAPKDLSYVGGGTCFGPAAISADGIFRQTPPTHAPVVIFMSDGMANDFEDAARTFDGLFEEYGENFELHVIGFGDGTDTAQLHRIARCSSNGRLHTASNIDDLSKVFVDIAGGGDAIASVLEAEIGKQISDAVKDRLSAEYF